MGDELGRFDEAIKDLDTRMGGLPSPAEAEEIWDECRSLSPMHRGMSYERLAELNGIQWPCPDEDSLEPSFLHGRLWEEDPVERGMPATFSPGVAEVTEGPASAHAGPPSSPATFTGATIGNWPSLR